MADTEELMINLLEKIKYGENLMAQLKEIHNIDGVMKLHRKIKQETEFLKKVNYCPLTLIICLSSMYKNNQLITLYSVTENE